MSVGPIWSCAALADRTARCWGDNSKGQLGNGTTTASITPVTVSGLTGVVSISTGEPAGSFGSWTSCAVRSDHTVWCWGSNTGGKLGSGTANAWETTPVKIVGISTAVEVSVGNNHVCARGSGGEAWCWGSGIGGRLGEGSDVNQSFPTPVAVTGLSGVVDVTAGPFHSCAVKSNGTVWCWGSNGVQQLGDGTFTTRLVPVQAIGITDATQVDVGYSHTCALRATGAVACWGSDANGQLGNGPAAGPATAVAVTGLTDATSISVGYSNTCAVRSAETVVCWGSNAGGSFGTGTTSSVVDAPVAVPGVTDVTSVSANGQNHFGSTGPVLGRRETACFVSTNTVRCAGSNEFGLLADGTTTDSFTPVLSNVG